ncbi:MAG TPA: hypothetical protein VH372_15910 [Actinospica sp.]|jgi:hypothetical protein|nr:hypothetical protein [Actinospica sp.]
MRTVDGKHREHGKHGKHSGHSGHASADATATATANANANAREPRVLRLLAAGLGAALQSAEVLVELGAAGATAAVRRAARSGVG